MLKKVTSKNDRLFNQKYHTYLASSNNYIVFVEKVTSIQNRFLFVSYSLDSTYLSYTTIDICMNRSADWVGNDSNLGTKRLKLGYGTTQTWVRNDCTWVRNDRIPKDGQSIEVAIFSGHLIFLIGLSSENKTFFS